MSKEKKPKYEPRHKADTRKPKPTKDELKAKAEKSKDRPVSWKDFR